MSVNILYTLIIQEGTLCYKVHMLHMNKIVLYYKLRVFKINMLAIIKIKHLINDFFLLTFLEIL